MNGEKIIIDSLKLDRQLSLNLKVIIIIRRREKIMAFSLKRRAIMYNKTDIIRMLLFLFLIKIANNKEDDNPKRTEKISNWQLIQKIVSAAHADARKSNEDIVAAAASNPNSSRR